MSTPDYGESMERCAGEGWSIDDAKAFVKASRVMPEPESDEEEFLKQAKHYFLRFQPRPALAPCRPEDAEDGISNEERR